MLLYISSPRGVAIKLTRCVVAHRAAQRCHRQPSIAINSIEFPLNDSTCNYVRRNQHRNIAPDIAGTVDTVQHCNFVDILQLLN